MYLSLGVIKVERNKKMEVKEIKITDENYPKRLKEIKNPPKKLYVMR